MRPDGCRWALAGRNRAKLETVRGKLAAIDPALSALDLLVADSTDAAALTDIARATKVVATTVGPYVVHGEPLVAACAAAGTDYVDLTGEPEFVDTMYTALPRAGRETGARLVHACGFDSIPHDLGAYFTVLQLPEDVPITMSGYVQASGDVLRRDVRVGAHRLLAPRQNVAAARERKPGIEAVGRTARHARRSADRIAHAVDDGWALPFPSLDPQVVARSARAVDRYGPDFRYSHNVAVPHLWTAGGLVGGVAGLFLAAPRSRRRERRCSSGCRPARDRPRPSGGAQLVPRHLRGRGRRRSGS